MSEANGPIVPGSADPARGRCPDCGGELSEPVSGDVHCHVVCRACGAKFELDDPRLSRGE